MPFDMVALVLGERRGQVCRRGRLPRVSPPCTRQVRATTRSSPGAATARIAVTQSRWRQPAAVCCRGGCPSTSRLSGLARFGQN